MKKILFLLCVLLFTNNAFCEVLVYKWIFLGPKYDKQSVGNTFTRQTYYGYMLLQFRPNTKRYDIQLLVMYWTENGKRYRKRIDYPASFTVNTVVPNSNGFTFMKNFSQPDWNNISFEFTSAKKQIIFNTTPELEQKDPIIIDGILSGHRILDKSDDIGNFTLNYGKTSAKLDVKLTKQYLHYDIPPLTIYDAAAGIEQMLDQSGYNQWTQ